MNIAASNKIEDDDDLLGPSTVADQANQGKSSMNMGFLERAALRALERLSDGMLQAVEQRKTPNGQESDPHSVNIADDYDARGLSSAGE